MTPNIKYMSPFLITSILMVWIVVKAWPRRKARGGGIFILFCLSAGYWSLTEGMLYLGLSVEANLLITCFQYIGIIITAPHVSDSSLHHFWLRVMAQAASGSASLCRSGFGPDLGLDQPLASSPLHGLVYH